MNPFKTLDQSWCDYRAYTECFQRFRNQRIRESVRKGMDEGDLLWREPLIQISRQFKPGTPLDQLAVNRDPRQGGMVTKLGAIPQGSRGLRGKRTRMRAKRTQL